MSKSITLGNYISDFCYRLRTTETDMHALLLNPNWLNSQVIAMLEIFIRSKIFSLKDQFMFNGLYISKADFEQLKSYALRDVSNSDFIAAAEILYNFCDGTREKN